MKNRVFKYPIVRHFKTRVFILNKYCVLFETEKYILYLILSATIHFWV